MEIDGEWLESLYETSELLPGKQLSLPWPGKGRQIRKWNAVLTAPRGIEKRKTQAVAHEKPSGQQQALKRKRSKKALKETPKKRLKVYLLTV